MASNNSSSNYHKSSTAAGGGMWFLGFIGALIYYMQHAHSFWQVLYGIFQAIFWPAYLVYGLLHLIYT